MRVTMKDIAARVGVTEQAVSYALRGVPKVGAPMRKRILAEAERLGYRPHVGARAMAKGSFGAITILQDAKGGYSFLSGALLRAIVEEADRGGRHLGLARISREQMEKREALPQALRELCSDGLLVNINTPPPAHFDTLLARSGLPSIWLNIRRAADCVHPDDRGGALMLMRALHQRGCRRIGYFDSLADEPDEHYSKGERYAGYLAGMEELGLPPQALRCPGGGPSGQQGRDLLAWLRAHPELDTLVTYAPHELDYFAYLIQPVLARPTRLRLASFFSRNQQGNLPALRAELPALEMARQALAALETKIAAPRKPLAPMPVPFTLKEPDPALDW